MAAHRPTDCGLDAPSECHRAWFSLGPRGAPEEEQSGGGCCRLGIVAPVQLTGPRDALVPRAVVRTGREAAVIQVGQLLLDALFRTAGLGPP